MVFIKNQVVHISRADRLICRSNSEQFISRKLHSKLIVKYPPTWSGLSPGGTQVYSSRAQPESSSECAACRAPEGAVPAEGGWSGTWAPVLLKAASFDEEEFMFLVESSILLCGRIGSKCIVDEWSSLGHLQFRQTCLENKISLFIYL